MGLAAVENRGQIAYVARMNHQQSISMPIPGHIDPVPVPRAFVPRKDGRIDLLGL
ncbi:MAG: 23S rRNA (adenine(2503)-C(2))-methyltransferase RlmN, partial [Sphingomonadales bacterium]